MNKSLQQLLALSAFILGISAAAPVFAADAKAAVDQDKVCTTCHDASWDKPVLSIYQTRHGVKGDGRTPGCRSCHGTSDNHLKSPSNLPDVTFDKKSKSSAEAKSEVCMNCHTGANRTFWTGSKHPSNDVACSNCHTVHAATDKVRVKATQSEVCFTCHKTQRAEMHKISTHPIAAGKVACSDCHNTHGSAGPKLMREENVRDTCFTCHAEKRGPFLHEHPSAMENCMNCHTPHGSTNAALLKARMPWLCQECHSDSAPHPGGVYSGNNLPGGAQANANKTGGLSNVLGAGATLRTPQSLNAINPVTGLPVTAAAGSPQIMMRGCVNCHSQVHGSNHPGGQRFTR